MTHGGDGTTTVLARMAPQRPQMAASRSSSGHHIIIQHQATSTASSSGVRQVPVLLTSTASGGSVASVVNSTPLLLAQRDSFDAHKEVETFWRKQKESVEDIATETLRDAHKNQQLPLARIKKIMKMDDDVKAQMVAAEAPVLFAKACEFFIRELTLRSWVHTEDNKRKTLQKNDIAMAISKYEQFDFLIDIVPREEANKPPAGPSVASASTIRKVESDGPFQGSPSSSVGEQLQYFVQMPASGSGAAQQSLASSLGASTSVQLQNGQIVQATPVGQPIQLQAGPGQSVQLISIGDGANGGQPIQLQVLQSGNQAQILQSHPMDPGMLEEEDDDGLDDPM